MLNKIYTFLYIFVILSFLSDSAYSQSGLSLYSEKIIFIENQGQIESSNFGCDILYSANTPDAKLFFARDRVIFIFASGEGIASIQRTDLFFEKINPNLNLSHSGEAEEKFNYYYDHCPDGIIGVNAYNKITYRNIYPNIDLVFYQSKNSNSLKYDFVVRPGGNPSDIGFSYLGGKASVDENSDISVESPISGIVDRDLFIYQNIDRTHKRVQGSIEMQENSFSFTIEEYDRKKTLVIDPNIIWSRLYGGKDQDHAYSMVVDSDNNIYISGHAFSADLPISPGAFQETLVRSPDVYVAKFDQLSNRLWSTYYGGGSADYCRGLTVDENDSVYISGQTFSDDFPVTEGAYQTKFGGGQSDAYVVSFNSEGERRWATFCGGNDNDQFNGIAADKSNDFVFATGWTTSDDFPTELAAQPLRAGKEDVILTNFSKSGDNIYFSTYWGGDSTDIAQDIAIDASSDIIITGRTSSVNYPIDKPLQASSGGLDDVIVTKFNNTGNTEWSTYFGGSNHDRAFSIATASDRSIHITGNTQSDDIRTTNLALQPAFGGKIDCLVFSINSNGSTLLYSSYHGGIDLDYGEAIALDSDDNILITGSTSSTDFPVVEYGFKDTLSGPSDAFATKFFADYTDMEWSGYIGGSKDDVGYAIKPTGENDALIAGDTESDDFEIILNDEQEFAGDIDAFLIKLCRNQPSPEITIDGGNFLCEGDSVVLDAGDGYAVYNWSNDETTQKITIKDGGLYWVTVFDDNSCAGRSEPIEITVHPQPEMSITGRTSICEGESTLLSSDKDFAEYKWSNDITKKSIEVQVPGKYYLEVTDINGCKTIDSVEVFVNPNPEPEIEGPKIACVDSDGNIYLAENNPNTTYNWEILGGTIDNGQGTNQVSITWNIVGKGTLRVTEINNETECEGSSEEFEVQIDDQFDIAITSNNEFGFHMCEGETMTLSAEQGLDDYEWSNGETTSSITVDEAGKYWVYVSSDAGCWGTDTIEVFTYPYPQPQINGTNELCLGDTAYFETLFVEGNSYEWETDGGNIYGDPEANQIGIIWTTDGNKRVRVKETVEPYGCATDSELFDVLIHPTPEPEISHNGPLNFCEGDSVELDAGPGYKSYLWSNNATSQKIWAFESGTYQVRVTSEFDCRGRSDIEVEVDPIPDQPNITEFKDTLYSTFADNYQWFINGEEIPGANGRNYYPTESGEYSVKIWTKAGCENLSDPKEVWRGIARAVFKLRPEIIEAKIGETVNIQVEIDTSNNLPKVNATEYSLYIRVNRTTLRAIDRTGEIIDGNHYLYPISGTLTDTIGYLGEIKCKVYWGNAEISKISLDRIEWNGPRVINTVIPGYLQISDLCQAGEEKRLFIPTEEFSVLQNKPNPVEDKTIFEFNTIEKGYTILYIVDLMGRVKDIVYEEYVDDPGKEEIQYDSRKLPSGKYFYILKTPSQTRTMQMNVVR
jgi:hypothetical protein